MIRRTHPALSVWAWLVYAFLYLPIIVLVVFSFNDSRFGATWAGFTTKWYGVLFARTDVREALTRAAERCVSELDAMRCNEGAALSRDLSARLERVRATHRRLVDLTARCAPRFRERVRARVGRLLEEVSARVDDARLEQEIVLLAEHTDVTEELTRLGAHVEQFAALLSADDPVGRRMDFVLQEMSREANTLGAKAIDAEIALEVVELKAELERLREQAQNVE